MKTAIKYILINRAFLVLMALFCTLLTPMLKQSIQRGNTNWSMFQGDHTYQYAEPESLYQNMWAVWDSKWYISIAEDGYSNQRYPYENIDNKGFLPVYPFLIWLLANILLFGEYHIAGIVVSNIFLILSFYILKKFIESDEKLKDKVNIKNTYLYLLYFPTSYFLSSIYPESLYLFLSILSLYLINKNKILLACLSIGLASMTKIFGIFLLIPLLFYLFKNRNKINPYKLISFGISLSIVPIIYLTYTYIISGDFFAYMHIQESFFRHEWSNPLTVIFTELAGKINPQIILHGFATIFGLIVLISGYKLLKIEYMLYSLSYILFTPVTGMTNGNARYIASLFFIPIILGSYIKNEDTKIIYVYTIAFIQGLIFIWWLVGAGFTS